jgi:hypothetical protein
MTSKPKLELSTHRSPNKFANTKAGHLAEIYLLLGYVGARATSENPFIAASAFRRDMATPSMLALLVEGTSLEHREWCEIHSSSYTEVMETWVTHTGDGAWQYCEQTISSFIASGKLSNALLHSSHGFKDRIEAVVGADMPEEISSFLERTDRPLHLDEARANTALANAEALHSTGELFASEGTFHSEGGPETYFHVPPSRQVANVFPAHAETWKELDELVFPMKGGMRCINIPPVISSSSFELYLGRFESWSDILFPALIDKGWVPFSISRVVLGYMIELQKLVRVPRKSSSSVLPKESAMQHRSKRAMKRRRSVTRSTKVPHSQSPKRTASPRDPTGSDRPLDAPQAAARQAAPASEPSTMTPDEVKLHALATALRNTPRDALFRVKGAFPDAEQFLHRCITVPSFFEEALAALGMLNSA